MRMLSRLVVLSTIFGGLVVSASSAKLVTTWRDPEAGKVGFAKVVVALVSPDADLRRRVEGGLARRIRGAVAANTLIPDGEIQNREAVVARLKSSGVDGVIVLRHADVASDVSITPGRSVIVSYASFDGFWNDSWAVVSTPSYASMTKVVTAEIVVYAVATEKPVWAGRLTAENPKSLRVLLDELVKAGAAELREQKLV